MADDVRISTALPRHPKTVKLLRRLHEQGCWALLCLLLWVADNRPDGDLSGMTTEDIEIAADWNGEAGKLVTTLAEVGFLDGADVNYRIHDWEQHNPWVVGRSARVAAAREAANQRWERERQKNAMQGACEAHAERMRDKQNGNAHHTTTHHDTKKGTELKDSSVPVLASSKRRQAKTALPANFAISESVRHWASKHGHSRLEEHLEHFIGYAKAHGARYADWDQALINAIRGNWAKLENANGHAGVTGQSSPTPPLAPSARMPRQLESTRQQSGGSQ